MRLALWVGTLLLLGTIALAIGPAGAQEASLEKNPSFRTDKEEDFAQGRILVKLDEDTPKKVLDNANRRNNARVKERLEEVDVNVIDLPRGLAVSEAVGRYDSLPGVEYAEPDFQLLPDQISANDPEYSELYGLNNTGRSGGTADADIDAPEAWSQTTGQASTLVAVIDTGADISHPDLKNNIWTNPDEIAGNKVDDDQNGYVDDIHGWDFVHNNSSVFDAGDGDKHGTHVAGTIAAEGHNNVGVAGVNWRASIMPLKFLGPKGGSISAAVEAIDYAVNEGATISNNSYGCGGSDCYSKTLKAAIDTADGARHLFVTAAGNDGTDNDATPHYPSNYDSSNIISAAATDKDDKPASFSNYGEKSVDLGAPGLSILSTVPGGYARYSGTSMAAPHVAGVAALIKSQQPDLDDGQVKAKILQSVNKKPSLSGKTATGGRLNAAQALGIKLTNLSFTASSRVRTYGKATTLSGRLTSYGDSLGDRMVILEQRRVGAKNFGRLGEVTTAPDGTFRLGGVKPIKNTVYRARFAGSKAGQLGPSTSPARRVNVRVRVNLNTASTKLKLGKGRTISGAVGPRHGGAVAVSIKRNGSLIARKKVSLNQYSRYRFVCKPQRPGTYAFFAAYPKHADHLGNRSPQKSFKVVR